MLPLVPTLTLCSITAFGLAAWLEPVFHRHMGHPSQSDNVVALLMGDSRRIFALHFYQKADSYFHSGYYPSRFDTRPAEPAGSAPEAKRADDDDHAACGGCLGKPVDWLDRFSRYFYPSEHRHLGERQIPHDEHGAAEDQGDEESEAAGIPGEEREMLPWLRLAAELDPEQPQTYVVASFWLRSRLGRINEAEQFLREGLRHNPHHPEILFELGRIYREHHQDRERARNVWELALTRWRETEGQAEEPDQLLHAQLLGNLAKLAQEEKRFDQAIGFLEEFKTISPHPDQIQRWLDEVKREAAGHGEDQLSDRSD